MGSLHVTFLTGFQNLVAVFSRIVVLRGMWRSRVFSAADLAKPASKPPEPVPGRWLHT